MQDQRHIILWTAIAFYAAAIVTCIVATVRRGKTACHGWDRSPALISAP